ncbi:MAG: ribonuclease P protein component [Patescibacteria group bacterium]
MLSRRHRLRQAKDFIRIYRRGQKRQSREIIIYWLKTPTTEPIQVGIVLSRQVSHKANLRNLYRRRLAAVIKEYLPNLPATGLNLVVVANRHILLQDYKGVQTQLVKLLSQIK